ncbi:hypothetical protein VSVS12_03228 [Vibrio scophthalmi]|uniref:Uncharacterized protein n=2 Tax=Vibrio TaxID=662 RepID=F9S4B5_9VIBR|nr:MULTISPECIES: phage tail protein [Vibrio]ANS86937.1 hypothetical protein VSVS12_03228 [Vibrio scophthalmi]EGU36923.1 hypothetical protein VII00023_08319 [Vibrio ichthyoenteri ATCC 700023]ODS05171.1 hypothetical protein VSF3289_04312 [Vibrio scophthalmi]
MNNAQKILKSGHWGAWGDCGFKTLFTPHSISDNRTWRVPAQNVLNGYPHHQFMGEGERTLPITIAVHNEFCDLAKHHDVMLKQSNSDDAQPLVIGHNVLGFFKCKSMSQTYDETTPEGILIASTYQLSLVEVRE